MDIWILNIFRKRFPASRYLVGVGLIGVLAIVAVLAVGPAQAADNGPAGWNGETIAGSSGILLAANDAHAADAAKKDAKAEEKPHGIAGFLLDYLAKNPFAYLFLALALGYPLGRVSVAGIQLGTTAGTLVVGIAIALTSLIPGITTEVRPLMPALQSNWLAFHVITCFLGYAAFAIAFGVSIAYMIQSQRESSPRDTISWLPSSQILDEINYKAIVIGFPMLTLGIITGVVWAHSAWGSYWTWDPKETWSLITWLVYAALLHARMKRGWRGKRLAILSIVGFCCVLFTYFGVNYLAGLHSYAQ